MKLEVVVEGKSYEVEVDFGGGDRSQRERLPRVPSKAASARSGMRPPRDPRSQAKHDPLNECRSPLLGLVASVQVAAGQAVREGDLLLVLEAMKMETPLFAPADCSVRSVRVRPGDSVKPNDLLIEFG